MKAKITTKAAPKRVLVISDVDGTLVKGSLVLNHAVSLHKAGVIDLGELPALWLANLKNEKIITQLAEAYREAIVGLGVKELAVSSFLKELSSNETNFYSSLKQLVELQQAGADVLLISGSPNFLVSSFARSFGFKAAASKYHRDRRQRFTGKVTGMFSAGAKEAHLKTVDITQYDEVIAYGDTSSDAPLFALAHRSYLVDPSPETAALFADRMLQIIEA